MQTKEFKQFRTELRKLFLNNGLQARVVYHDYYDSCHAPIDTPNAEWQLAIDLGLTKRDFLTGSSYSLCIGDKGICVLNSGYKRIELRIKK